MTGNIGLPSSDGALNWSDTRLYRTGTSTLTLDDGVGGVNAPATLNVGATDYVNISNSGDNPQISFVQDSGGWYWPEQFYAYGSPYLRLFAQANSHALHMQGTDASGTLNYDIYRINTYTNTPTFTFGSYGNAPQPDVSIYSATDATTTASAYSQLFNNGGSYGVAALAVKGGAYIGKTLLTGGNVGIGTTSPSSSLQVVTTSSTVTIGNASNTGCLELGSASGTPAKLIYVYFDTNAVMYATTTKPSFCQ